MAKIRRGINVEASLLEEAGRTYAEYARTADARLLSPSPSMTQLAEGGLRLLCDFLEGKLVYRDDLPGIERHERAVSIR